MAATALEFLSVQLFGRPMRLPVALQILDNASGIFYATEIADAYAGFHQDIEEAPNPLPI